MIGPESGSRLAHLPQAHRSAAPKRLQGLQFGKELAVPFVDGTWADYVEQLSIKPLLVLVEGIQQHH